MKKRKWNLVTDKLSAVRKKTTAGKGFGVWTAAVLGSVLCISMGMQVKAAPQIAVRELTVSASGDGVRAECVLADWDETAGYTVWLQLEKSCADGSVETIVSSEVLLGAEGSAGAKTSYVEVPEGRYCASVAVSVAGAGEVRTLRFENSPFYQVVKNGDDYEIRICTGEEAGTAEEEEKNHEDKGGQQLTEAEGCAHLSERIYSPWKEAAPESDAILSVSCAECGEILSFEEVPNSAYKAFLTGAAEVIRLTPPGEMAVIKTDRWMSFDREVLKALESRRDIILRVKYRYQGRDYETTIPAGADVTELADEHGFCGFLYLNKVFEDGAFVENARK